MASFRGHILNAAIRYAGKRRLADLEFTPADDRCDRARGSNAWATAANLHRR